MPRPSTMFLIWGSSPRVRGKLLEGAQNVRELGLIPACAGKTFTRTIATIWPQAHPRVCGENNHGTAFGHCYPGSSPRVRGKLHRSRSKNPRIRLIPACAGKTESRVECPGEVEAHPRVCGENSTALDADSTAQGSSPRVRGKLASFEQLFQVEGLIPACAGKTNAQRCGRSSQRAHPRVCGENDR